MDPVQHQYNLLQNQEMFARMGHQQIDNYNKKAFLAKDQVKLNKKQIDEDEFSNQIRYKIQKEITDSNYKKKIIQDMQNKIRKQLRNIQKQE